jgi:hypothetical protein
LTGGAGFQVHTLKHLAPNTSLSMYKRDVSEDTHRSRPKVANYRVIEAINIKGEEAMIKAELTLSEIGLIAVTRGLLGAGHRALACRQA